jgi:hypothetical protein
VAIYNQLHSHLEVVAGAIHVLQHFTTSPITVYVHRRVISDNLYGFKAWMQPQRGIVLKKCKEYDNATRYDLVWFVSPEYDLAEVADRIKQMQPKAFLLMIHNGHMLEEPMQKLIQLAGDQPLFSLAPHVANFTMKRPRVTKQVEWVLPIYPFSPAQPCTSSNTQVRGCGCGWLEKAACGLARNAEHTVVDIGVRCWELVPEQPSAAAAC